MHVARRDSRDHEVGRVGRCCCPSQLEGVVRAARSTHDDVDLLAEQAIGRGEHPPERRRLTLEAGSDRPQDRSGAACVVLLAGQQRKALKGVGRDAVRRRHGVVHEAARPSDREVVLVRRVEQRPAIRIPEVREQAIGETPRQVQRFRLAERGVSDEEPVDHGCVVLGKARAYGRGHRARFATGGPRRERGYRQ